MPVAIFKGLLKRVLRLVLPADTDDPISVSVDGSEVFVVDASGNIALPTPSAKVDGVDVSAHNHSTGTDQTRLHAKDRTRTMTWALTASEASPSMPAYFCGDGNATGFTFTNPVHVIQVQLVALGSVYGAPSDPPGTIELTIKKSGATVGSLTLTGVMTESEQWYKGTLSIAVANQAYTTADKFSMIISEGVSGVTWSCLTAVVTYTID